MIKEQIEKACFEKRLIKTRFFYIQLNHPFIKKFDNFWDPCSIKAPFNGRLDFKVNYMNGGVLKWVEV
ncbi:hypothetical protein P4T51_29405 [Bacillus mycoides]|uniref:hypothetical protein n=1 Tax=Bacillus mycoides TaxID=1405 RepID=UPI002E23EA92|nr:hypothetical protein [Bacillus mycoides]